MRMRALRWTKLYRESSVKGEVTLGRLQEDSGLLHRTVHNTTAEMVLIFSLNMATDTDEAPMLSQRQLPLLLLLLFLLLLSC